MPVIVTCGPSYEPIDQVRRLTNFSTGELGVLLCDALARAGHDVICLKGVGATYPNPAAPVRTLSFATNDDLQTHLERLAGSETITALFHTAALCDFKVAQINSTTGERVESAKIPSRTDSLTLILEPARKVIQGLRPLFPEAKIVGWKYELVGTRDDAVHRGLKQLADNRTTACIVNGTAYGPGFGFCTSAGLQQHLNDKTSLCQFLVAWLQ